MLTAGLTLATISRQYLFYVPCSSGRDHPKYFVIYL
jgi:hypothetical protein